MPPTPARRALRPSESPRAPARAGSRPLRCQERLLERRHVLVAATGETDEDGATWMGPRPTRRTRERVRALERRQDSFELAELPHALERLRIARGLITHATTRRQQRVLRPYPRRIEPGRDRMRLLDLAIRVLQQQGVRSVEHAGTAVGDRGSVLAKASAPPAGLDADDLDRGIGDKGMEGTDGVGSAADAGDERIRQPPGTGEYLRARLPADDRLELAYQVWVRMRADHRAEQIISSERVRHPVAQRLVDRGAQRAIAARDRHDARAEQPHASDIWSLALHVAPRRSRRRCDGRRVGARAAPGPWRC